jgi:hypothetical protein
LARCAEGVVEASRLARVAQPCRGPETGCSCPWDRLADCAHGCAIEGLEVVIDRAEAPRQLCAPEADASDGIPWIRGATEAVGRRAEACDDGQLYRCAQGVVVDCRARVVLASCARGCFAEGAAIDDEGQDESVSREAAFAILCSR